MTPVDPVSPPPLGSTWDGRGVHFGLFSRNALAVDLCLFDGEGVETRVPVRTRRADVWYVDVPAKLATTPEG